MSMGWLHWGAGLGTVVVVLVAMSPILGASEGVRINCFLLGSVLPGICPLPSYFTEDPLFTYESDPQQAGLPLEERKRLDRLYFPRTRQILVEKFDMVFVFDPRLDHFSARQFGDLDWAFREGGMPSLWAFGPSYTAIHASILDETLPISAYDGYFHRPWRVVFRTDREPVFTPFIALGMERVPGEAYGWMQPRQGAVVWADMVPYNYPWMVSWRPTPNGGLAWVCADEFNMYWWALMPETRGTNPYAIDLMTNLVLYSLGRPLIADIFMRREARHVISLYRTEKLTILSMLEFADKFGANILPLSNEITGMDSEYATAMESYLHQEYPTAIGIMNSISLRLTEIGGRAIRLKDEALFWVYVSEYAVVTAAAIMTGSMVWTIMVRRKVYKAVQVTRIRTQY